MVRWGLRHLFPAEEGTTYVLRQGGARGADALAKSVAAELGWELEADWKPRYTKGEGSEGWNKVAPLRRTEDMLDGRGGPEGHHEVPPAVLVVFRDGPELPHGGTGHAVREARKRRLPIVVFETPEE